MTFSLIHPAYIAIRSFWRTLSTLLGWVFSGLLTDGGATLKSVTHKLQ